ncbi:hypothetical protein BN1708_007651 [Verticillium longisporum]|uniref:Uncharacterized protein n=1 Tax=Verticillium longisporum TaxID=100787 RepID=A0A0G4MVU7_VERLO|nr:hypothetical protein BN1708_007651 [Verticillium longisporum]
MGPLTLSSSRASTTASATVSTGSGLAPPAPRRPPKTPPVTVLKRAPAPVTAAMGRVRAWIYEDQLFSEPYETFYEILTSGAHPKGHPGGAASAGAGAGAGKAGGAGKGKTKALPPLPDKNAPAVWERTAIVPAHSKPGHEFSRDTEQLEIKKLKDAQDAAQKLCKSMLDELKDKEAQLARLKEENAAAAATAAAAQAQAQAQAAGQA